jgi:hypothetical protein
LFLASSIFSLLAFLPPGEIPLCVGVILIRKLLEFDVQGGEGVKPLIASLLPSGSPVEPIPVAMAGGILGAVAARRP